MAGRQTQPMPAQGASTKARPNGRPGSNVPQYTGPLPSTADPNYGKEPVPVKPRAPAAPPVPPPPPVAFNNGSQHYNPTTAPYGMDMSMPGVYEQLWNNNQNLWMQSPSLDWVNSQLPQFESPWFGETWNQDNIGAFAGQGAGQQFWNQIAGSFNTPSEAQKLTSKGYQGPNLAMAAFGQTQSAMPGTLTPQFDAYYDRMSDKATSLVNSESAARGSYGSSSALNNSIGAGLDVEAQRAKDSTDFSLADSQNQLNWFNSLAQQGRAADLSGQGAFGLNLEAGRADTDRLKTFGDLAFRAEDMEYQKNKAMSDIAFGIDEARNKRLDSGISTGFGLDEAWGNRLDSLFDAGSTAQNQREGRIGGLYDDVSGMSRDVQSFVMDNLDQLMTMDSANLEAQIEAMIGQTADARGWDQQQQDRVTRDVVAIVNAVKTKQAEDESAKRG